MMAFIPATEDLWVFCQNLYKKAEENPTSVELYIFHLSTLVGSYQEWD